MQFEEYNGWPNRPTWTVFTVMTSYYETQKALEKLADTTPLASAVQAVKSFVERVASAWEHGDYTGYEEAAHILLQDFLAYGVRCVNWTSVYDVLRGEKKSLGRTDELTTLAYELLASTDWQSIVEDAETLVDADTLLRDWLEDQYLTWLDSPDARQYQSRVSTFVHKVLEVFFAAVKWLKVTQALRTE